MSYNSVNRSRLAMFSRSSAEPGLANTDVEPGIGDLTPARALEKSIIEIQTAVPGADSMIWDGLKPDMDSNWQKQTMEEHKGFRLVLDQAIPVSLNHCLRCRYESCVIQAVCWQVRCAFGFLDLDVRQNHSKNSCDGNDIAKHLGEERRFCLAESGEDKIH